MATAAEALAVFILDPGFAGQQLFEPFLDLGHRRTLVLQGQLDRTAEPALSHVAHAEIPWSDI